jgi:hypothetical protein
MSRLAIAISGKILWATGDVRLWVELDLDLKDNAGNSKSQSFRVDSATDVSTFPAFQAKLGNLPFPRNAALGAVHNQTGLEIRSGYLRFRVVGMDQTEYALPCLFLGDPDTPPTGNPAAFPRALLQPLALLDWFRVAFDKDATVGAPHGEMILEKK